MMENSAANAIHIWRIHQNGPCEPVKVASVRNSLVWNILFDKLYAFRCPRQIEVVEAAHPACDINRNALVLKVFTQFPHPIFLGDDSFLFERLHNLAVVTSDMFVKL